jgi:hypothetical protein
MTSIEPLLDHK